jgi:hypothetical protein
LKALLISSVAALALGLGIGTASAAPVDRSAEPVDKTGVQAPDGLTPGEEERGRRWMRSWRDQQRDFDLDGFEPDEFAEQNWDGPRRVPDKFASGSDDRGPSQRFWPRDENRPSKPS